jgi:hypothetical protein
VEGHVMKRGRIAIELFRDVIEMNHERSALMIRESSEDGVAE